MNSKRQFSIPCLDGIRAVSFLIVFTSHAGIEQMPGLFGVAVFFFLSGYLITTLMRMEIASTGSLSLKGFYLRRSFRILPPFYFVMCFILALVALGILSGSCTASDLFASLFYLTNYWNIYVRTIMIPGFNIFWSLAVEEHFYLVFPLLILVMLKLRLRWKTQALILLGVCAAVLAWRCVLVLGLHSLDMKFATNMPLRTMYGTDTRIDSILFGSVLALWGNPMLDERPKLHWGWAIAGASLLLATFVIRSPEFRETFRYSLQGLALMPLFISAIQRPDHWAYRWLESTPAKLIGVLSYTLYLVHSPILMVVQRWSDNRLIIGVVALSLSLALAYAMHILVEEPCARLRRKFGSRSAEIINRTGEVEVVPTGD